ncbi:hypothetical protein BVRB_2g026640 [Beta vulgaris subsp. vulgaris]|nr:hypothetical protein BVRB_2g026640 [Beta vulgaris subsp. vulgaris]
MIFLSINGILQHILKIFQKWVNAKALQLYGTQSKLMHQFVTGFFLNTGTKYLEDDINKKIQIKIFPGSICMLEKVFK